MGGNGELGLPHEAAHGCWQASVPGEKKEADQERGFPQLHINREEMCA